MKLDKKECIAVYTMMENVSIPAKEAKFVSDLFDKFNKEIIRLDKLENKGS